MNQAIVENGEIFFHFDDAALKELYKEIGFNGFVSLFRNARLYTNSAGQEFINEKLMNGEFSKS